MCLVFFRSLQAVEHSVKRLWFKFVCNMTLLLFSSIKSCRDAAETFQSTNISNYKGLSHKGWEAGWQPLETTIRRGMAQQLLLEAEHALFLDCVTLSSFSGACEFLQTSWHCSHDWDYLLVTKDLKRRFLAHHPLWSRNNHKPAGKYRLLPMIYGCQRVNDHPSRPVRLRPTSCQNDVVYSLMLQSL